MTELEIKYSLESEIERVKFTISKFDWYMAKGYKVILPTELTQNSNKEDIEKAVTEEYSSGDEHEKYKLEIQKMWADFTPQFEQIKNNSKLNFADKYTLVLTKFGTGGSYHSADNSIEVRFTNREASSIFGTILHEIVHLAIEPIIKKYNVSHWRKERLVDLLGLKYFPDRRKAQQIKEDVSKVDEAFNQFFPDIELIIKEIK